MITWLIITAPPELQQVAAEARNHFAGLGISLRSFCLAVLAGATMTLMTWMQLGADSGCGRIMAAISMGFLIADTQMFHSVLDSLLMFAALRTPLATFGYLDWLTELGRASGLSAVTGLVITLRFAWLVRYTVRRGIARLRSRLRGGRGAVRGAGWLFRQHIVGAAGPAGAFGQLLQPLPQRFQRGHPLRVRLLVIDQLLNLLRGKRTDPVRQRRDRQMIIVRNGQLPAIRPTHRLPFVVATGQLVSPSASAGLRGRCRRCAT